MCVCTYVALAPKLCVTLNLNVILSTHLSGGRLHFYTCTFVSCLHVRQSIICSPRPSVSIVCTSSCVRPSASFMYLFMMLVTGPNSLCICVHICVCRSPSLHCKLFEVPLQFCSIPRESDAKIQLWSFLEAVRTLKCWCGSLLVERHWVLSLTQVK